MFVVAVAAAGIFVLFSPLPGPTGLDTFQIGTATFNVLFTGVTVDITKTDFPDPVLSGGTLNYSILVSISGNSSNVTVVDIYPGNIDFASSAPPPSIGNNTWDLGNLTNTSFQINITVTVSPAFTGFLINNATAFFNQPNGSFENVSIIEVTTVVSPAPPPPSGGQGGGTSSGAGFCPPFNAIQRKINGQTVTFYTCCVDADCGRIWGLSGYVCGSSNAMLAAPVCVPSPESEAPVYAEGMCPVARTCGALCCDVGKVCANGKCAIPRQQELLMPAQPPSEGSFIILGVQETSILWLLLLIILAIVLLIILAILASLGKERTKKRRKQ
jgi:hypothetical protein